MCYVAIVLTLSQIRGQPRAIGLLRRAIAADRVPHAYLFSGPPSSGKHATGLALAAAINCLDAPGEGCGTCASCAKIAAAIHPDVLTLERQGAMQIIPIETIRAQVIPVLGMLPHEGRARFFLIEEAASLLDPAANSLLKTLEEPPQRTHFILATTAPHRLLPTIRSRCQRLGFAPLSAELRAELAGDSDTAERLRQLVSQLESAAQADDFGSLATAAGEVAAAKGEVPAVLELLAGRLYQRARSAAMDDQPSTAATLSRQATVVLDTHSAITHNALAQLSLEAMLHQMRRVRP
jgi:DNA polymerase III delta' subunit